MLVGLAGKIMKLEQFASALSPMAGELLLRFRE
jgi:hypothetical protein